MTPDEIIDAYNVLAQNVQDNAAAEAARVGNAQRSLGTLAARVASPANQTYGLANYTYDRVMRPTVDATAKSLATKGLAAGLENKLTNELRAAKNRYEDSQNRAIAGSGGGTTGSTGYGNDLVEEEVGQEFNPTFDFEAMVDSVRQHTAFGDIAFKEDVQAQLYQEYLAGKFDEAEWKRLWLFAENEYPSRNDAPYNKGVWGGGGGGGGGW